MQHYHEYDQEQDIPPLNSLTTPETLEVPELTEQDAHLDYEYLQELEQQGMLQDRTQIDIDEKLIATIQDMNPRKRDLLLWSTALVLTVGIAGYIVMIVLTHLFYLKGAWFSIPLCV